jgi:diadenylate cyclase
MDYRLWTIDFPPIINPPSTIDNLCTVLPLFITFRWLDALDILIVAILLFQLYRLIRGTVAVNIFLGVLSLYLLWLLVRALDMRLLGSILGQFIGVGVIALIIVFQQELRRFLLIIGTSGILDRRSWRLFGNRGGGQGTGLSTDVVVNACMSMAQSRTGAILILARDSGLKFYTNTGEHVDAALTVRMLESIFYKNSPLHDGAVIIAGNRIRAARCVLPVTENEDFPAHLGMRHRAAVGISETSDAIAVVVSEQTGGISVARKGQLESDLSPRQLRELLDTEFNSGN